MTGRETDVRRARRAGFWFVALVVALASVGGTLVGALFVWAVTR